MKPTRRLEQQPQSLADYCAQHPQDVTAPSDQSGQVWRRFRDAPAYKALLHALCEAQQGLCIYCEQRVVDESGTPVPLDHQVEHVQPKSAAPGLVLDWENLALACCGGSYQHHQEESRGQPGKGNEACGQYKGEKPLRPNCDPRDFPFGARLIQVDLEGMLAPDVATCNQLGVPHANLDATINQVLNLNCERLRVARQKVLDNIRAWYVLILQELSTDTHLSSDEQRQLLALGVAGRLKPDSCGYLRAFWSTERYALGQPAEDWVLANSGLFE